MFSGIFKKPSSQNEHKRKSQMSLMTLKNKSQDPWDREDRPDLIYDRLYSSQVWKIKIFYALAYDPFSLTFALSGF